MTLRVLLVCAGSALLTWASVTAPARAADEPAYPHGDFRQDCGICHTGDKWKPAVVSKAFKHTARFPLLDAHATAKCGDCHASLDFKRAPTLCADCHRDPHIGELGADCGRCHTPRNFIDRTAQLDAHRLTRFPLTGAHVTRDCQECHLPAPQGQLQYVNTPVDCQACHLPEYQATTNPNHVAGGFPLDCAQCHAPTVWSRASFNHSITAFPLTGAHITTACVQCHSSGYNGTPTACIACHNADYVGAPNHVAGNYPTDCLTCHTTVTFAGATFNHALTGFPLTGAHTRTACVQCHSSGYTGTPTACIACHNADYVGAPNHVAGNYPTDCLTCHTTVTFAGATFNHALTAFPLTGAHITTACVQCHSSGYSGTPTACIACHNADAQNAADPNHVGAGFMTDCATCHNTTSFQGSRFTQHDTLYFRIYSSTHNGRWDTCSTCHDVPSSYAVFNCIGCHTDPGTSNKHNGVNGYQYNSQACYTCHDRG